MKRVVVFLMIAVLMPMLMFGQKIENRTVSDFAGIDASGAFNITVVKALRSRLPSRLTTNAVRA